MYCELFSGNCWHCRANFCLFVYEIFSLCRGTIGEKCSTEWVQSTYTTSAWTFLVCWDVSVHFCFGFFLSYFFPEVFFCERGFFPWVHWPCTLNKFWCHCLSFRLAHPNTLFAIYLVLSIRPVVYGIFLHAYTAFHCCVVLAPVIHTLPAPSCCLAQAYGLSVVCLHAVPQMRVSPEFNACHDKSIPTVCLLMVGSECVWALGEGSISVS